MEQTWLVLLPPLLVLSLAFIIRHLPTALILGLCSAALIATDGAPLTAGHLMITRLIEHITDIDNIYTYTFLMVIGMIIVLINLSGGAQAFARAVTRRISSAKTAQTTLIPLSLSLFLDDYLNSLTVGSVMRPITDHFAIPRAKLAYLVHSLSGAITILVPISSWVTMIVGQLDQAGINQNAEHARIIADPFFMYFSIIPFIFYALMVIASVWFVVRTSIAYGPMHTHETIAHTTGNVFGGKTPLETSEPIHERGSLLDLFVPLATLLLCVAVGIPYFGGYTLFGGTYSLLESFQHNNDTFLVLLIASCAALGIGIISSLMRTTITVQQIPIITYQGFDLMINAILIVALASTLGYMLRIDLHTGAYLATLLLGSIAVTFIPCIFFMTACITSLILGTAWGTIALLIPIALPMVTTLTHALLPTTPAMIPILYPALGAILSGALFGDQVSPIAGASVVTATSTGTYLMDHTITQLPYALPVMVGSIVSFTLSGFLTSYNIALNAGCSLIIGTLTCFALLKWLHKKPVNK